MGYKELTKHAVAENEKLVRDYWESIDLLKMSVDTREDKPSYIFYEGPPTANGKPGIHHVLARALKDSVCRIKTMQGYQVKRKEIGRAHV